VLCACCVLARPRLERVLLQLAASHQNTPRTAQHQTNKNTTNNQTNKTGRPGRRLVEGPPRLPPVGRALPARGRHRRPVQRRRAVGRAVGRLRGRPRRGRVVPVHGQRRPRPVGQQAHQQGAVVRPGVFADERGAAPQLRQGPAGARGAQLQGEALQLRAARRDARALRRHLPHPALLAQEGRAELPHVPLPVRALRQRARAVEQRRRRRPAAARGAGGGAGGDRLGRGQGARDGRRRVLVRVFWGGGGFCVRL
jgi:hypothetical protein